MAALAKSPSILSLVYERCLTLRRKLAEQSITRSKIKLEARWLKSESLVKVARETIAREEAKQAKWLATVPDATPECEQATGDLFALMRDGNVETYGDARLKFGTKSTVNKTALLADLRGDVDEFLALATVTQKAVADHAKQSGKAWLLRCIETTREPKGVEFTA